MTTSNTTSVWEPVKELMGKHEIVLGRHLSYQALNSPRRILYMMSYYKFAAKMIGKGKRVLDIGCGEGLGTWLLAKECGPAVGIDLDDEAVAIGKQNWPPTAVTFETADFLNSDYAPGSFDAIVSFDVIEHIAADNARLFMQKAKDALAPDGMLILGTPNITSDVYASPITKAGHVNLYSGDRLADELAAQFSHVMIFGANDEVVHTGFLPMAHYLIAVACD